MRDATKSDRKLIRGHFYRVFHLKGFWLERGTMFLVAIVASLIILIPLGYLLYTSIMIEKTGSAATFTLNNYLNVFVDPRFLKALFNTFIICLISTLISTFIGSFLAWIIARTNTPLKGFIASVSAMPFFVSAMIIAIAWMYLAAPKVGLLNKYLIIMLSLRSDPFNIYSIWGIIWVMTLFYTPEAYLFTVGTFKSMDPSLEESARIYGSGILRTTLKVTIPLSAPAIISSALLIFVSSAGVFGIPLILGLPVGIRVLSTHIQSLGTQYPFNYGEAAAASAILLFIACMGIGINRWVLRKKEFVTISPKGFRPSIIDLKGWKYFTMSIALLYVLLGIVLPFSALGIVALSRVWQGVVDFSEFTLANLIYVMFEYDLTLISIKNSLFLGIIGSFFLLILSVAISYLQLRTNVKGRGVLDYITSIPIGVPGIVMGMAMLLAWIRTPLYGTIWILMIAYLARFFPYGVRIVSAGLRSIAKELDESSRIHGGSWIKTMKRVTIPLLKPSMSAGWILLFILFVKELPVAVLLSQGDTSVMSVALVNIIAEKLPGETASFALIQTTLILLATLLYRRVTRGGEMTL